MVWMEWRTFDPKTKGIWLPIGQSDLNLHIF